MKTTTSKAFTIFLSAVALALLLSLAALIFNPISYHKFEEEGYSFNYKGSFGTVRRVVIKSGDEKIASVNLRSDADIFSTIENFSAVFEDLNADGKRDILLPTAHEDDGDVIYSLILSEGDSFVAYSGERTFSNVSFFKHGDHICAEESSKEIIAEKTASSPEFFIRTRKISKLIFVGGEVISLEERASIYYSETDYCCYSIYEYDEAEKALVYVDEIWFDPADIDKYPLKFN